MGGRRPKAVVKGCCGSLMKYASVALGSASAYVEHPVQGKTSLKAWDHASGVIAVEEAGGRVTDLEGKEVTFKGEERGLFRPTGLGVVVTNGKLHDEILEGLRNISL